ncbi:MAG: PKD domain-containing protein [Thermoplasmatales archaeon]|nr:MAG: PKD domain-containing protein [Thermoplasmatales archaeon]
MKKIILFTIVIATVMIMSSYTTIAKPDTAPGQQRKNYGSQREYVLMILTRNLERIQNRGGNATGLFRLVMGLFLGPGHNDKPDEEDEYDELEVDANGDYEGIIGVSIELEGNATGGVEPYNWSWDLGDGNSSLEQNPQHIYEAIGNYTAILTVEDDVGAIASDTAFVNITAE